MQDNIFININVLLSLKEIRIPDQVLLFNPIQNLKCVKLRRKIVREKKIRVINKAGDGVNCLVHHQNQLICHIEIR